MTADATGGREPFARPVRVEDVEGHATVLDAQYVVECEALWWRRDALFGRSIDDTSPMYGDLRAAQDEQRALTRLHPSMDFTVEPVGGAAPTPASEEDAIREDFEALARTLASISLTEKGNTEPSFFGAILACRDSVLARLRATPSPDDLAMRLREAIPRVNAEHSALIGCDAPGCGDVPVDARGRCRKHPFRERGADRRIEDMPPIFEGGAYTQRTTPDRRASSQGDK